MNTPNGYLRMLVAGYSAEFNLPWVMEGHYAIAKEGEQQAIARAYTRGAKNVRRYPVLCAYGQLRREINEQYAWLIRHEFRIEIWRNVGQPYASSLEMSMDVAKNRHLYVFAGGEAHPFFDITDLVRFRAVHDIFGHATEGYQFGNRGEVNAWIHHSMMFSPLAQRALTTETLGQTSWVNFGPFSKYPAAQRPYAEQKMFLLPSSYCDWKKYL